MLLTSSSVIGVSVLHATPVHLAELEAAAATHPTDVSSIRLVTRGSLVDLVPRPDDAPSGGASLGLSETMTLATSIPWDSPVELRLSTNGRPLPGTLAKIIDPQTGAALATGEHGEVALKGTTLMKGYHKAFPETYLDGSGFYRTGDGGFLDEDGYLHWTGRISQLIRTNSANVSPAEVENALHEIPEVKLAVVFGTPDASLGEVVVACVVRKAGAELSEGDLRARLKQKLAGYKIPRHVLFLEDDELEMTSTGKARLGSLREMAAQRLGLGEAPAPEGAGTADKTSTS